MGLDVGTVKGADNVLRNLNREIRKIEGHTRTGVLKAALLIRREANDITPIDTGNLRGSAYTTAIGNGLVAEMGYTASYAPFVHENLKARHRAPTRSKFLEVTVRENFKAILELIRAEARVR